MAKSKRRPRCIVIAGPNGAGKPPSREYLVQQANVVHFVNADLIVARISPLKPGLAALDGGHDVPRRDVMRRFSRSLENFERVYRGLADVWAVYENSGATRALIETAS